MALTFDGSNDYINLGGLLNEGFAIPLTFCAWIRPANTGVLGELVGRGTGTTGWGVTIDTRIGFVFSNIVHYQSSTLTALANNTWSFIAVRRNTTTNLRFMHVTTAGAITTQNVATGAFVPNEGGGVSSCLGMRGAGGNINPWNGQMAHAAYWDGTGPPTDTDLYRFARYPGITNGLSIKPHYYWPLHFDGSDHSNSPQNGSVVGPVKSSLMPPTRRTPF